MRTNFMNGMDIMTPTHTKKKVSFLSIALGSLIVTSLSTGTAEAKWSSPRCKIQCTKNSVSKSDTKLNDCATNCDNTAIMDVLLPNAEKLNAANKKHFQTALSYQQSTKEKEHTKVEEQLKAELAKKKPSKSKINDLNKKQDKLINEINTLGDQLSNLEKTSKAPPRPTSQPMSTSARDAFKFMELPETATATEVQTKYKALALKHHPDKGGDEATFKQLSEANETLKKHFEEQGETVGSKAPERPKSGPRSSRRTSEVSSMLPGAEATKAPPRPTSGPHINEPDISKPPSDLPPEFKPEEKEPIDVSKPPSDLPPTLEDIHGHQAPSKSHAEPSNQPKQPPTLLEQIQAAKDLKLKKVQTKESPNIGAGKVVGTDHPTTETAEQPSAKQSGGSDQPKQPLTLLEQIQAKKQLKKVTPEEEAARRAAAEEKLKNDPRASQPAGGGMFEELKKQMAQRRPAFEDDKKPNPHQDFEQDFDD